VREQHANEFAQMNREHEKALSERDRVHARALERLTTELRRERKQTESRLSGDVERIENGHREEIEQIESRHADEIEVLKRLHQEAVQELEHGFEAERERLRTEHVSALDQLADRLRSDQRVTVEGRESEWQERLDRLREEYDRALESEREELKTVLEALAAARAAAEEPAASSVPTDSLEAEGTPDRSVDAPTFDEEASRSYRILGRVSPGRVSKPERASKLLRHLAAELDDLHTACGQGDIDMPDVDAALRESDTPAEG
jgi:kinesin family protein 4/21/27